MEYIIYSGGNNGYSLYSASANFPEAYKADIKTLYETNRIASNENSNGTPFGIRMAPFADGYLISVIYRNCTGNGESRQMYAGINWFFSYETQIEMFLTDKSAFAALLQGSNETLKENGYTFTEVNTDISRTSHIALSENEKKALMSSVYSATINNENGVVQAFAGYNKIEDAYDMLFWMYRSTPSSFWKYFKVYIGAASASETSTSHLVFMNNATLAGIDKNECYNNSMPIPKIATYNNNINGAVRVPDEVKTYLSLSADKVHLLNSKFIDSDNVELFWKHVKALSDDTPMPEKIRILGEACILGCVQANIFTQDELIAEITKNKSAYKAFPAIMAFYDDVLAKQKEEEENRKLAEKKRGKQIKVAKTSAWGLKKQPEKTKPETAEIKPEPAEIKPTITETKPVAAEIKPATTEIKPAITETRPLAAEDKKQQEEIINQPKEAEKLPEAPAKQKKDAAEKTENIKVLSADNKKFCFSSIGDLLRNQTFQYSLISVMSLLLIFTIDLLIIILTTGFSINGVAIQFANNAISIKTFILTIICLNIVNLPLGYLFIASAFELFKTHSNK